MTNSQRLILSTIIYLRLIPCGTSWSPVPIRASGVFSSTEGRQWTCDDPTTTALKSLSPTKTETAIPLTPSFPIEDTIVRLPAVHYTVPGFKRGWQDEEGQWWDEEGTRNGPPQNYWRQMADERPYNTVMDAVLTILKDKTMEMGDDSLMQITLAGLEKGRTVRRPLLNRKLLGKWAPLIRSGIKKGEIVSGDGVNDKLRVAVPYTMECSRTNGRKLGPATFYGTFDAHMEEGEEMTVTCTDDGGSGVIRVSTSNDSMYVGMLGGEHMSVGGITHLSEYAVVMKGPTGAMDFWLRVN